MLKNTTFLLLLLTSMNCFSGFCDGRWGDQSLSSIHVHKNIAYISIIPGLSDGHDSDNATIKTEVGLVLNEENRNNVYPLLLTAFAAQKSVVMTYCDGIMTHGYKGGDNTVVKITSVNMKY